VDITSRCGCLRSYGGIEICVLLRMFAKHHKSVAGLLIVQSLFLVFVVSLISQRLLNDYQE